MKGRAGQGRKVKQNIREICGHTCKQKDKMSNRDRQTDRQENGMMSMRVGYRKAEDDDDDDERGPRKSARCEDRS